jgi:hypothetical protein
MTRFLAKQVNWEKSFQGGVTSYKVRAVRMAGAVGCINNDKCV